MQRAGGDAYLNPVYDRDFPDPYVLKFRGEYWAYCTSFWRDGRAFGVMRSRDLVRWEELAGALAPLPGAHPCYWAPEVVYRQGRFLMYYSVGNEKLMHIRVAVADHPAGPFEDTGHQLTHAEFAIDPHVYAAPDGTRWLFYATDFLTHTHIGTGTVRDRLLDDFTLAGEARPVTRARYDWQVYDPHRVEKGGVRWHTVEGPFVLAHKGRLYQMFSGGNWQNLTYGVSYAVSESVECADEWRQTADGQRVLPILRTIPGQVIGPGHNSVVRGPDNRQLFCVYHRWREGVGRVLAIDPLDFVGERMTVLGPTTTPQPAPNAPTFADHFDEARADGLGDAWTPRGGRWSVAAGEVRQDDADGVAEAVCAISAESFLAEFSLRALGRAEADGATVDESVATGAGGGCGVSFEGAGGVLGRFLFVPETERAVLSWRGDGAARAAESFALSAAESFALPAEFAPAAWHTLRVEVDQTFLKLELDEGLVRWQGHAPVAVTRLALCAERARASFAAFAFTVGWEDLFEQTDWAARGWQVAAGDKSWRVEGGELKSPAALAGPHVLAKGAPLDAYELVVNLRLEGEAAGGRAGFYPAYGAGADTGPLLTVERGAGGGWALVATEGAAERREFALPETFDPNVPQQFRVRRAGDRLHLRHEAETLGDWPAPTRATRVALYAHGSLLACDMVRLTEIESRDG
ncbi:MAG TPA: glycoside hydrolase family 43 protein [Pyrinomonadaceae bacterium]|jgi:GH43 family beta-xylosidase